MSNPFTSKIQPSSPTFTLSAVALVLGLLLGTALITRQERQRIGRELPTEVRTGSIDIQRSYLELQREVTTLRGQLARYEKAASETTKNSDLIQQSLQAYKSAAGLTELTGPGLVLTLRDSEKPDLLPGENIIHDTDLLRIVNDLWISGAEAIAINGQRLVTGSPIRCVGPTIQINYVPTAAPIKIQAIGDPTTLHDGMLLPGGAVKDLLEFDPKMVSMDKVDKTTLPAFAGAVGKKLGVNSEEAPKP